MEHWAKVCQEKSVTDVFDLQDIRVVVAFNSFMTEVLIL